MYIEYRNNTTRKICEDEAFARKKYPDKVVDSIKHLMFKLSSISSFQEFSKNPANRKYKMHSLKGSEKEFFALRLDFSYRMTIKLFIDNNKIIIWEISNHYGD